MILLGVLVILFGLWVMSEPVLAILSHVASASRWPKTRIGIGTAIVAIGIGVLIDHAAFAAELTKPVRIAVPDSAALYRRTIEQATAEVWGEEGSPARLAAQIDKESRFNPKARSYVGAEGMAQFMPDTSHWIAEQFPKQLGTYDPWDPAQAVLAAALYDHYLYGNVSGASECDRWAFALSAYNGGLGWINRDRRRASATGADPARWFGHVELTSARARSARVENRDYVRRILMVLEPSYVDAGWPGTAVCS